MNSFTQVHKVVQMIEDASQSNFANLRILDLACLEGAYALEFAAQGATVVGIEGREENILKAYEAKERLGLSNVTFYQDDVRNLSKEKYGEFDVVLCSGILYHLNYPDCFQFLERISEVCTGFLIIDTHVTFKPTVQASYNGHDYLGMMFREHNPNTSMEDRLKSVWASLDNELSFWFTKASLFNFLSRIGFSSISESISMNPPVLENNNRITILTYKKRPVTQFHTCPNPGSHQVFNEPSYNHGSSEQEVEIYRELVNNLTSAIAPSLQKLEQLKGK